MFSLSLLADGLNVLAIHAGKIFNIFSHVLKVLSLCYCLFWEVKHGDGIMAQIFVTLNQHNLKVLYVWVNKRFLQFQTGKWVNRLVQNVALSFSRADTKYSDTPCCGPVQMSHNCFVVSVSLAAEWFVCDDGWHSVTQAVRRATVPTLKHKSSFTQD